MTTRVFITGQRRRFEVVSFDPETHVAVLINEAGEEIIDPNFWVEIVKRCYTLTQEK